MVRIYDATDDEYLTIEEFIDAYDEDDTNTYYVQFLYKLDTLFDLTKERTALRGKYARDEQGNSLLNAYAMTDDEEDLFDRFLEIGSGELFRKLNAWTKNVFKSYQYKALHDFGGTEETVYHTGTVTGWANPNLTDSGATFGPNDIGRTLEYTSGLLAGNGYVIESVISATEVKLTNPPPDDPTGMTYKVYEETSTTENSLQFFITMPDTPYFDLFESAEVKLEEALILYCIKEYYLLNRFMQDFQIEQERYDRLAHEVKSLLMMKTEATRRNNNMLGTTDY